MSDGKVPYRLSSLQGLWKPARNTNVLKGLLAVLLGAVLISTVIPAAAQASGPRVTINRINGQYVVQGWGFAPNTRGQVWAKLGSLTGQKQSWINNTGYFWLTFYAFTPNHTGASQIKAWDTKGAYATADRTMGSGDTAKWHGKSLVEMQGTPTTTQQNTPNQTQQAAQDPTTTVKPTTTTAKPTTTTARKNTPSSPGTGTGFGDNPAGWNLAWSDDFNGNSLDHGKWGVYNGSGNQGVGTRSGSAVSVGNGELRITGDNWVGGGMASSYKTTYGLFEVRAKFDKGSGYNIAALLWPASEHWPQDGELDLAEMFNGVTSQVGSFAHWGSNNTQTGHTSYGDFSQWHTYAVDWEQDSVTYFIDGQQIMKLTGGAVPHSNHFMGLQLDVSRDGHKTNGETFHVDWVKVYKH